ncbi:hypothetical protein CONPUDRAFT_154163 [Coniophora puteana RWD-64-598 SS2]|uniref:DRBM domain-containing protein n=1 Tax=Coniophora puteana (strain RWD-64-598) TaxID=741705 RepID=A0A5M3MR30_CONPW|nr:uncharacterized protein CONPUDRAFT_154163 [Coniophora puteana RWD-64-598 SS2]EIW81632.1 hypothetical protein CONPUDRAFT_154163 [Coniophora puteana RWD-64-598 SS2]
MPNGHHNKMELNNFLQGLPNGSSLKATWATNGIGPEHKCVWHATVTIAGKSWRGEHSNKRDAEDLAAAEALKELRP